MCFPHSCVMLSILQLVFEFLILSPLVQNLEETIPLPAKDWQLQHPPSLKVLKSPAWKAENILLSLGAPSTSLFL